LEAPQADVAQALFVLASCPVASALDWTLVPAALPAGERARHEEEARTAREDRPPAPLAFDCQVLWSGSAGTVPTILGASVAQALGAPDAVFAPATRMPMRKALEESTSLGDPAVRSRLLVAHTTLPPLLPSPDALAAVAPALRPPVRPRLPEAEMPHEGACLGWTYDGRAARLSVADRLRHVWILGQTGTGKSTLMLNRILQDLEEGHGVAVFDPHGELVDAVRRLLPASRRGDVVLVDLADRGHTPPALNLLECGDIASAHVRAGQVIELVSSLWPRDFCGPVFEPLMLMKPTLRAFRCSSPARLACPASTRTSVGTTPVRATTCSNVGTSCAESAALPCGTIKPTTKPAALLPSCGS
jgi:hypothetical protein